MRETREVNHPTPQLAQSPSAAPRSDCLSSANRSNPEAVPAVSQPARLSPAEQQLLDAGLTPEILMRQWGVILWSIKPKEGRFKIKIDVMRKEVDLNALTRRFEEILRLPVSLKQSPTSACCESPCKGCIWVDPEKRAFWSQASVEVLPPSEQPDRSNNCPGNRC